MSVNVSVKNNEDPIKNDGARVLTVSVYRTIGPLFFVVNYSVQLIQGKAAITGDKDMHHRASGGICVPNGTNSVLKT